MGEVKFPSFFETRWEKWMDAAALPSGAQPTLTVVGMLNTLTDAVDPYSATTYTAPSTRITNILDRYNILQAEVDTHRLDVRGEPGLVRWIEDWEYIHNKLRPASIWAPEAVTFNKTALIAETEQTLDDIAAKMAVSLPELHSRTPEDRWDAYVQQGFSSADALNVLKDMVLSGFDTASKQRATAAIDEAFNNLNVSLVPASEFSTMVSQAKTSRDVLGMLDNVAITTVLTNATAAAIAERATALSGAVADLSPTTDWVALVTSAVAKADTVGVLKNIDLTGIVTAVRSGADSEITLAVAAAVAAVNDPVIATLISRYSTSTLPELAKSKRRMAGGMADLNAVNGSAFLFALASLESERLSEVDRFAAEIISTTYRESLNGHIEAFKTEYAHRIEAAIREKINRDIFVITGAEHGTRMHLSNSQYKLGQMQIYQGLYTAVLSAGLDAEKADQAAKLSFLQGAVASMVNLQQVKNRLDEVQMQVHGDIYKSDWLASIDSSKENKQARDRLILSGAQAQVALLQEFIRGRVALIDAYNRVLALYLSTGLDEGRTNKTAIDEARIAMMTNAQRHHDIFFASLSNSFNQLHAAQRDAILLTREHEAANIEKSHRALYWDLDAMLTASSMFGALSGGSHLVQRGPSGFEKGLAAAIGIAQTVGSIASGGAPVG